jgi:hypothetical protein
VAELESLRERQVDSWTGPIVPLELAFADLVPAGFARACAERQVAASREQLDELLVSAGDALAAIETRIAEWERSRSAIATRVEVEALVAGRRIAA